MTNPIQAQGMLASATILFTYWLLVFSTPFLLLLPRTWSHPRWEFWLVYCAAIGYFTYTGVRAWRRGWRARFIQRIVVPAALLAVSCGVILLLAIVAIVHK